METKANIETQPPLLLISHGEGYKKQSFYNVLEDQLHTATIRILRDKRVLASNYGWLVLVGRVTNDCCLWNPVSMDIIELPELKTSGLYSTCVLSKSPTEPDCHILFNSGCHFELAFCQIGDGEFVRRSLLEPTDDDVQELKAIGSCQGNIYGFVGYRDRIVTIHFVGKTIEFRSILKGGQPWHISVSLRPWATWHRDYLIESPGPEDGELLLVRKIHAAYYIQDCRDFRVYRVDINRMECRELENIGQRAIFVSHLGEAFCSSSTGLIKPNSIYYTRGHEEARNMHIYDLNNRSTTLLRPCPIAGRSRSMSYWIDPKFCIK